MNWRVCDGWAGCQAKPRAFAWNGVNYLTTLSSSLDFLNRVKKVVEWFGFHLLRNPFVVPMEGVPMKSLPPSSQRHVQSIPMDKIREMENMILEEERCVWLSGCLVVWVSGCLGR